MDEALHDGLGVESLAAGAQGVGGAEQEIEAASAEYLGRWNRLVSTTNWEKGRIICQWRQRVLSAGAPLEAASDEAWSRRVGNVSPQHVGRLRRVFQRFGEIHEQFQGLYWSHFLAALDWHDAEMWLEGAVQSNWSVARMRAERWQALGAAPDEVPCEEDVVSAEADEDAELAEDFPREAAEPSLQEVRTPEVDAFDEPPADAERLNSNNFAGPCDGPAGDAKSRPFENLPPLPNDLADAFETFKVAILNHKLAGWRDVSAEAVLAALDALKELAAGPSDAAIPA